MIDILMPFWGEPEYLYEAVRSVQAQRDPQWRLTVVDDCYPQDVRPFFEALEDPRIRYLRNESNLGIIENFRRCQGLAQGDYAVFMGCDDLLAPDYVGTLHRVAAQHPGVEILQTGVEVINGAGVPCLPLGDRVKDVLRPSSAQVLAGEELARSLMVGNWLYWPSLAFRSDVLATVTFDDYEIILDLGLVMDLVTAGARLALTPERMFRYRRHAASLSSQALDGGPRLADERHFFAQQAQRCEDLGWPRAARAARQHLTSRALALTLIPAALASRTSLKPLLIHALH